MYTNKLILSNKKTVNIGARKTKCAAWTEFCKLPGFDKRVQGLISDMPPLPLSHVAYSLFSFILNQTLYCIIDHILQLNKYNREEKTVNGVQCLPSPPLHISFSTLYDKIKLTLCKDFPLQLNNEYIIQGCNIFLNTFLY